MNVVEYVIQWREKGVNKAVGNSQKAVDKLDRKVKETNKSLSVGTVAAVVVAAGAIASFVNSSVKAYDKQAKAEAQVRQGLITTRGVANRTFKQLTEQASSLQNKTLFGDEEILKGVTAQLLTFTNISGVQFDRTQQAALDLSTRLDGDLKSSSIQLGKALNDPVANLSALSRSGIQFSKDQKTTINTLVKTGNLAKAQTIILDELEKQYGGSAAAAAAAGSGGLTQLSNKLGDIQELIGKFLMPVINVFAAMINRVADFVQKNSFALEVAVQTIAVLAASVGGLILVIKAWVVIQKIINVLLFANPIGLVIAAIAALVAGIVILYKRSETFRGIISGVFNVLKLVYNIVWNQLKKAFAVIRETFKGTGGDLKKYLMMPINFVIDAFNRFLDLLEKIPGVGKLVKGLRDAFKEGFKEGVEDFRKEQEKAKLDTEVGVTGGLAGNGGLSGATGLGGPKGGTPKAAEVRSAAPKQFNINIDKLGNFEKISINNVQEGVNDIEEKLKRALQNVVADIQVSY